MIMSPVSKAASCIRLRHKPLQGSFFWVGDNLDRGLIWSAWGWGVHARGPSIRSSEDTRANVLDCRWTASSLMGHIYNTTMMRLFEKQNRSTISGLELILDEIYWEPSESRPLFPVVSSSSHIPIPWWPSNPWIPIPNDCGNRVPHWHQTCSSRILRCGRAMGDRTLGTCARNIRSPLLRPSSRGRWYQVFPEPSIATYIQDSQLLWAFSSASIQP